MTDLEKLEEIKAVTEKGTRGTWYAHPYEKQVRTGFMRWLNVTEVDPQYQKHIASMENETKAIAMALNEIPWLISSLEKSLAREAVAREFIEGCQRWSEFNQYPEHEVRYHLCVDVPGEASEALSKMDSIK